MALAEVLSAMKELILEGSELPTETNKRREILKSRYPKLSNDELDDLSKLSPQRLGIYTTSIYTAEFSILENCFPITFALIRKTLESKKNRKLSKVEFAKDLQRNIPWRSTETFVLADNFLNHLQTSLKDLLDLEPRLLDFAIFERANLHVKRVRVDLPTSIEGEELSKLTVSDLLGLKGNIPDFVKLVEGSFDTVRVYSEFHSSGRTLPEDIPSKKTFAIGSRLKDGAPVWQDVPRSVFNFLSSVQGKDWEVSDLAQAFLEGPDEFVSEEEAFIEFHKLLLNLVNSRAILVSL